MLPRKIFHRILSPFLAFGVVFGLFTGGPVQAITYSPDVSFSELDIAPQELGISNSGKTLTQLISNQATNRFTLLGLTWQGKIDQSIVFKVKVKESGVWTDWINLENGLYEEASAGTTEAIYARGGTDPLLTAPADGIEVVMESNSGLMPTDLKVNLFNSDTTRQDRSITKSSALTSMSSSVRTLNSNAPAVSPQGAVVPRPRIVSRAEWGADETWRSLTPRMGTKVLAGVVHHTASTNSYTADQAPAQMRNLYAYFTQSLNYSDMGYNFLVDKFGTIYEGRAGCAVNADPTCDGPAQPTQGAHTAGLNLDTFGVSVIGNYDVLAPENPAAIVEAVASLMAWKIAPYGLDPNATASVLSTDTSGSSKFSSGQIATMQVITAHRDVGITACPGRYLYPYMNQIRSRATDLLLPVIRDASVTPLNLNQVAAENVSVRATIPATAQWSVEVVNEATGQIVNSVSGTQGTTGPIAFDWNKTDQSGVAVPAGRYAVAIKASIRNIVLPPAGQVVTLAPPPKISKSVSIKRISPTKTKVRWTAITESVAPSTSNQFRISSNGGKSWTKWRAASTTEFVTTKWRRGQVFQVEFRSHNVMGVSNVVSKRYTVAAYAPPKPAAVTSVSLVQTSPNLVTASWIPAVSDYESQGFFTRSSINNGKWSAWKKTPGLNTSQTLNVKPGDKVRFQVKEQNYSGFSPAVIGRVTVSQ
jgi:hypothetical protein